MRLPLFFQDLNRRAPWRPALQASLVATAAIAGYVAFMPLQPKFDPAGSLAAAEQQPQWVGYIERPAMGMPSPPKPVTSASYLVPDTTASGDTPKKPGAAAILAPKTAAKAVLPPRRPQPAEEPVRVASLAAPAAAVPDVEPKAAPRHLLSPVTDRLASTGYLLRPFHVVGDAVHNLWKSL